MPSRSSIVATSVRLRPGTYYAGYSDSFLISNETITARLVKEGFANVTFGDRKDDKLPSSVQPTDDPTYSDDWDTWVRADYVGTTRTMDRPDAIAWVVFEQQTIPVTPVPPAPPYAKSESNYGWLWLLGGLWLVTRRGNRRRSR